METQIVPRLHSIATVGERTSLSGQLFIVRLKRGGLAPARLENLYVLAKKNFKTLSLFILSLINERNPVRHKRGDSDKDKDTGFL